MVAGRTTVTIYGPGSLSFAAEIADMLRDGKIMHLSSGRVVAGLAYVSNVVDLMLAAAQDPQAVGQAYNACDDLPTTWREYLDRLAIEAGAPPATASVPRAVAYPLGWVMEHAWRLAGIRQRPLLTRMAVEIFATDQGHSIDKARRELGFQPRVGFDDGMRAVGVWLRRRDKR